MTDIRTVPGIYRLTITWPQRAKEAGDVGSVRHGGKQIGHLIHSGRTALDGSGISFGQCEAHYDDRLRHETAAKRCERNACRQFDSEFAGARFLRRIDRGEVC